MTSKYQFLLIPPFKLPDEVLDLLPRLYPMFGFPGLVHHWPSAEMVSFRQVLFGRWNASAKSDLPRISYSSGYRQRILGFSINTRYTSKIGLVHACLAHPSLRNMWHMLRRSSLWMCSHQKIALNLRRYQRVFLTYTIL